MLLPDKEEVAALFSFVSWKSCFSADPSKRRRSRRNSKRGAEPLTSAWRIGAPQSLLGAASRLGTRPSLAEVAAGSFSMEQNGGEQGDKDAGDRQTGDGHSEEETETEDEEVEDSTGQRRKPASTKLRDLLRAFRDKPGEAAHPAAEETQTEEVDEEERQALLHRQGASERGDTADDEAAQAEAPSCLDEAAIEDLWLLQQTNGETRKLLDNVFHCLQPVTSAAFDGGEAASSPPTFWRPRGAAMSPRRCFLPLVCERRQAAVEGGETEEGALERQELAQRVQTLRSAFTGAVPSFFADCRFFSASTPRRCPTARRRAFSSAGSPPCRRGDGDGETGEIQPRRRTLRQLPQREEKAATGPASPLARALPSSARRRTEARNPEETQTKEEEHGEAGKVEEPLFSAEGGEEEERGGGAKKLKERETKQEEETRQRPEEVEEATVLESSRESRSALGCHCFASAFRTSASLPPFPSASSSENALGKSELKEDAVALQIDDNPKASESGEGRSVEVPEPADEGRMASGTQNGPCQNEEEVYEKKPTEPGTGINEQEHAPAPRSSALTAVHTPDDRPVGKETGDRYEPLGERQTGHGEDAKGESDPDEKQGALQPSLLQGETRVSEERSKPPPLLSEDSQETEEEQESITGSFTLQELSSSISGKRPFRQSGLKTPEADPLASPACSEFTFAIDVSPQPSERAGAAHTSAPEASFYSNLSSETRQSPETESVSKGVPQMKLTLPRSRAPSSSLSSSSSSASSVCVSSSSSASSCSTSSTILSFSSSSSVPSLSWGPSSSTPSSSSFGCDESDLPAQFASSASTVKDRLLCLSGDQNVERAASETGREETATKTSDETLDAAGALGDTHTKESACDVVANGHVNKRLADAGDEAPSCPPHSEVRDGDGAGKAREPPPERLLTSDSAETASHMWLGSSVCIWEANEGEKCQDTSAEAQTRTCAIQATEEGMYTLSPVCATGPGGLLYVATEVPAGQREVEVHPRALLRSPLGSQAGGWGRTRSRRGGAERRHAPGRERHPAKEAVTTRARIEEWRHAGGIEKFRKVCFLGRSNSASDSKTYAVEKPLAHPGPSLEASHEEARESGEPAKNERKGRTRHPGSSSRPASSSPSAPSSVCPHKPASGLRQRGPRRAGSDVSAERREQNMPEEKSGDGGLCRLSLASGREPQRVSLTNMAFQGRPTMRAGVSPVPSKTPVISPASLPSSFQVFSTPRNLWCLSASTPCRALRSTTTPESFAGSSVSSPVEVHSLASSSLSSPPCERLPDDPVDSMRLVRAKLRLARAAQRGPVSSLVSASPGKLNEKGRAFPCRSAASEGHGDDSQRFFQFLRKTFEAGGEGKYASVLRPLTSAARPSFVSGSSPFSPLFACPACRQPPAPKAVTLTPEDKTARYSRCFSSSATLEDQRVAAIPLPHCSLTPASLLRNSRGAFSALEFQRLPTASCSGLAGELLAAEWATRQRGEGDKRALFRDEKRARG
ncbi:hypothetical protein TGRH88_043530 [Toxoplasma gondii]|uniref:REJ domain-containing protein n=1 Tax=Toxoplasma gondii TaxID=5811 RepID=A0A7J6K001_TOXGO|nr:hypothetical protein TGRH88_043530 [Toxoplasma gondii]